MLHYAVLFSALDYIGYFQVMFSVGSLSIVLYVHLIGYFKLLYNNENFKILDNLKNYC